MRPRERDEIPARQSQARVPGLAGQHRLGKFDNLDLRVFIANDPRGCVAAAADQDELNRFGCLLSDKGGNNLVDALLVAPRNHDGRKNRPLWIERLKAESC